MYIENEPWAEPIREAVGRLLKADSEGVEIEVDGEVVLIHSQESMNASSEIHKAIQGAVKALLPVEHKSKQVSVV